MSNQAPYYKLTEEQKKEVHKASENVRTGKGCWWDEIAKLILARDKPRKEIRLRAMNEVRSSMVEAEQRGFHSGGEVVDILRGLHSRFEMGDWFDD